MYLYSQVFTAESLTCLEASGFCYRDAGPSLVLLLGISFWPYVVEILQFWTCRTGPFTYSIHYVHIYHRWGGCWDGQHIALVLDLGGCRVGQPTSSLPAELSPGELSSIVPASLPYAARSKGGDKFSCFQALGVCMYVCTPT